MTSEQFLAMAPRLGWKHEYWDDAARLSCQPSAVTDFERSVASPLLPNAQEVGFVVRKCEERDVDCLVQLFIEAFDNAVEFVGWSDEEFNDRAFICVYRWFERGNEALGWIAERGDEALGAMLLRVIDRSWCIEPVMVTPRHQRCGVGAALLAEAVQTLSTKGSTKLRSRCHLGNDESMAWHLKHGFEEHPPAIAANHRWRYFQMLKRHHEAADRPREAREAARLAEEWRQRARAAFEQESLLWESDTPADAS